MMKGLLEALSADESAEGAAMSASLELWVMVEKANLSSAFLTKRAPSQNRAPSLFFHDGAAAVVGCPPKALLQMFEPRVNERDDTEGRYGRSAGG